MIYSKHMTINSYAQVTYKYNTKQKVNCEKWVQGILIVKTNLEDTLYLQTDRQTDKQTDRSFILTRIDRVAMNINLQNIN